jgi:flavin-dependent dehydrogenase
VREGVTLQSLTFEGDRVTGVCAKSKEGGEFSEQARIVVGADGLHSSVARMVEAPAYDEVPAMTCGYYTYWSGLETDGAHLSLNAGTGLLVFPTNDDLTCLGMMRPLADFKAFRSDVDAHYRRYATENLPMVGEQLAQGKREERYIGTADTQNYFRRPYGPGWALVGDAGYHRDPVTGLGISDAFRDAELLAEAIDAGFSARQPLAEALAGYEAKRNEAARPDYERTIFTAMLPTKAEMLAAMQANAPAAAAAAAEAQAAQP